VALSYVIKARAQREIERLAEWWAVNRPAAPGAVRLDLNDVLILLTQHPGMGTRSRPEGQFRSGAF
jgi:plasmid stabilization system protein ParE